VAVEQEKKGDVNLDEEKGENEGEEQDGPKKPTRREA